MYDYKNPNDLVKWVKTEYKKKNRYKNGGIGRYDKDGTRLFDCCGLYKCFLWHNYHTKNAKYYGKTQKDLNCEGLLKEAKEKGSIETIPEIPGVLVYQKGHMGIYIGDGKVIEATAKKYDGQNGKIYKTYFKGNCKDCDGKRTTWTHWFKGLNLNYQPSQKSSFLGKKGYFSYGDTHENIGKIATFMRNTFPAYTSKLALGNYLGPNLEKSLKEFQKRTKIKITGQIDKNTLSKLKNYGFNEAQ